MANTINFNDITDTTINGSGYFDKYMTVVGKHVKQEFSANRISKADYANVYLKALGLAITEANKFSLQKLLSEKQADKIDSDMDLNTAQIAKLNCETLNCAETRNTIIAETAVKVAQKANIEQDTLKAIEETARIKKEVEKLGQDILMVAQKILTEKETTQVEHERIAKTAAETAKLLKDVDLLAQELLIKEQELLIKKQDVLIAIENLKIVKEELLIKKEELNVKKEEVEVLKCKCTLYSAQAVEAQAHASIYPDQGALMRAQASEAACKCSLYAAQAGETTAHAQLYSEQGALYQAQADESASKSALLAIQGVLYNAQAQLEATKKVTEGSRSKLLLSEAALNDAKWGGNTSGVSGVVGTNTYLGRQTSLFHAQALSYKTKAESEKAKYAAQMYQVSMTQDEDSGVCDVTYPQGFISGITTGNYPV